MTVGIERLRIRRAGIAVDARRFLPPFILAGYGIFVLSLFVRGVMSWYINPTYIAPTTLSGAVLIGLAAVGIGRRSEVGCTDGCCATGDCGCAEPSTKLWTYGVLFLPLLLALIFPPRSLAAFSANERGPQLAGLTTVRGAAPLKRVSLSVDTRQFSLEDWVGALSADPNPRDYLGKPIVVSGIAVHNSASVPPGYIMVIRYLVTCCIADARPVGVVVKDISHGAIKDNQWVKVTGTMGKASYQGQEIAVVLPKVMTPVKGGSPYIY